jgi:hypothetical protein
MIEIKLLRHHVAGYVLFAVLISLCITIYNAIDENYDLTKGDTKSFELDGDSESGNIMEQLDRMQLIQGVSEISAGISQLTPGGMTKVDILGGLASLAIGVLRSVVGLVIFPYQIVNILLTFYAGEIPGVIGGLVAMIMVYIGFILLSAYLGKDV